MRSTERKSNPPIPQSLNPSITRDLVPLAFSTIGFAVMLGTAVMTGFLIVNRLLVRELPVTPSAQPDVNQPAATILLVGAFCTLIVPAVIAWMILSPVDVTYRRFGFAMVSGFGAIVVSLLSVPVNEFLGLGGMVGLLVLAILACLLLGKKILRERAAL